MKKRMIRIHKSEEAAQLITDEQLSALEITAERALDAIRSLYPNANENVIRGIFNGLNEYCPAECEALMERIERLAVQSALSDQLGGSWEACDE